MHVVTKNLRQVDVHGGFTAAAGHNLYTARAFPKEYWNRIAFVCEPTGRIIHQAILEHDGSGFQEKDGWNFAASADEWFGPVHAEVGPDGARSEEHTSELQSLMRISYAVFCLKKKKQQLPHNKYN